MDYLPILFRFWRNIINKNSWEKTLYAILAAEMLSLAGFSTSGPVIPFFLQDLGVTDHVQVKFFTGLISSLPAITVALFAPVWGNLADAYGRKAMLLRAIFGGAILMLLQGFVTTPWQLLVLKTLQGCVTGSVAAATILIASTAPPEETGKALGLLQMSIFAGNSIGPMFGGIISDLFTNRATFFGTFILLVIAGFIVAKYVYDDFTPPAQRSSLLKSMKPNLQPILGSPAICALMIVIAADHIASTIVAPFLPLYIQTIISNQHIVGSTTGIILGAGALSSAVAAVTLGKLSYRIGYERTLLICLFGATLFTIPQAFVTTPSQLIVLRVISSFFIGGNMPALNALISQKTEPHNKGSVYGISSSISSGSGALGPLIGSSMATGVGYGSVFIATGVILGTAGIATGLALQKSKD